MESLYLCIENNKKTDIILKTWYAVYTKSRNEKKIAGWFQEKDIEHFLPLVKKVKQWSDRRKTVEEPLFSCYVFVRIKEKEYTSVLQTPGVVRFITFEGKKVPVRDVQIEAIRKYISTGLEDISNEKDFIPGKRVRVIRGSLRGLEGHLIQILGKQRVKVEIDAIGQSVFLKIPMGGLEIL